MTATTLDNVNFEILLKQHGGNFARAKQAWDAICRLGKFGDVPLTYEGGLDVKGIRIFIDEQSQGGNPQFMRRDPETGRPMPPIFEHNADDLKRIEDIAAGDNPN